MIGKMSTSGLMGSALDGARLRFKNITEVRCIGLSFTLFSGIIEPTKCSASKIFHFFNSFITHYTLCYASSISHDSEISSINSGLRKRRMWLTAFI